MCQCVRAQCRTLPRFVWLHSLQLAQVRVPCNASANDDGRRDPETLAREIDRLHGLDALQLVDGQWVAIDTATTERRASEPNVTLSGNY